MLRAKTILVISVFAFVVNSCKKENLYDCFKISGPDETRIREVSGFRKIEVHDKIDLHLTQGPNFEVKVEAGKNLHANIKTDLVDSVLVIRNINKCNFVRSPKRRINVYVTLPYLKQIRHAGVGIVYFDNQFVQDTMYTRIANSGDIHINVNLEYLYTTAHGNGDLYAKGITNYCYNYTNGTNFVYLQDLTIKGYIFVDTYSLGHCYVNAPQNGTLEANIWYKGNIYYKGDPTIIALSRHNQGDLIKE